MDSLNALRDHKYFGLILVFVIALTVHLIGLNLIGRTWDEQYKVDSGLIAWDRLFARDFSLATWDQGTDHPMVAKYIYGFGLWLQAIYLSGPSGNALLPIDTLAMLYNGNFIRTDLYDKTYAVPYDFTQPRVLSALFNSLAVMLTVIIARYFVGNTWWSFLPGIFLLLTPRFVFLGQLATFESISVGLFMTIILYFYRLLTKPEMLRGYVLIGVLCGLFFWTRYNNIIIFPLLAGWIVIHYLFTKKKGIWNLKLLLIPLIACILGIIIWPVTWHDFPKYLIESLQFHTHRLSGIDFYYWRYLLFTTPIPLLIGAIIGLYFCIKQRGYWHVVALWFVACIVCTYSLFVIELGGTRYVVILYPILAILAAYGFSKILKGKAVLIIAAVILFLLIEQMRVFPYYLDYYNQFIGGAKGAINNNYDFSWWGEGQREVGLWINNNVPNGSTIGLITTPKYVFPRVNRRLQFKEYVDDKTNVDYVVVSRANYPKLSQQFLATHEIVYTAVVDNEWLVCVMKKKK